MRNAFAHKGPHCCSHFTWTFYTLRRRDIFCQTQLDKITLPGRSRVLSTTLTKLGSNFAVQVDKIRSAKNRRRKLIVQ